MNVDFIFKIAAIGIVVAVLSSPEFITAQKHWSSLRKKKSKKEIPDFPVSHALNHRICSWSLKTMVVAPV